MANSARKSETLRLVIKFVFMAVFVSLSESWETSYREKQCGTLYSLNYLGGEQFPFKDGYESANLVEDYRASVFGWNLTNSIRVAPGCRMEICNETYFDGVCLPVEQGSYPLLSAQLHPNFSGDVRSVSCNCLRECKCEDIFMKKSSCARAYLKGGCKTCNSYYTELANREDYFSENFQGKVEAFRLRKGCRLTLYTEENFEGEEEIISEEILENYNGTFSSYECECNDDEYVPKVPPPRSITFPPLVDVPGSVGDVIKMLTNETNNGHPGLEAALKSMQNRRSGKNAYILLLGSVGAGKSSTINMLLDKPNIIKFSVGSSSITSAVSEFRIPIQVDELGIANSELRVINTPGTGDTRGIEQDAKYLATLESYLDNHEELKHRIPNVVLIFHKYNENRIRGDRARFVKMLQGLESFRPRITDENYSNVIFVLTHFCSETRANRRRPTNRLNEFKRAIEEYSLFPKPIHLVVAENKPQENELPLLNGYYKLPNNEYYPRNLFEKLELVTKNGQDFIGMEVFRTAFRDPENFNRTSSHFPIVDRENSNVHKYLRILSSRAFPVTRVSAITTTTSPPRTTVQYDRSSTLPSYNHSNIQKERQPFILQLQQEDYTNVRKALVEMKLQELTIVEKIRQEEERSEKELETIILAMRAQLRIQLQPLLERMKRDENMMERMLQVYHEYYIQLRDTRLRKERELELKTMQHKNNLSALRNQMEALNQELRHKLSLQRRALEMEQKRLDLIYNWNFTQNATASESQAKLLKDLSDLENNH
ncbi:unnamed protein product [Orchesella dallaii]|uniref:G domain-containing protein n=1 Tax=Orchesella dallaii TaxID=48710 RepID=A0ABP1RYN1_9HEXA